MRRQKAKLLRRDWQLELDRRGKTAIERGNRPLGDAGEDETMARLGQFENAAFERVSVQRQRQIAAIRADKSEGERNHGRILVRLARRGRNRLRDVEPA